MASTNQTPHYNLPQFLSSDKPSWLGDINPAFLDIDTQLFKLASDASDASSSAAAAQQAAQASQTAAELAQTQAQTATENVAKVHTKVTSLEQSYTTLAAQQNTQGSDINTLKTDVAQVQTDAQSAQTTANAAQTAASNAQVIATTAQSKAANILLTFVSASLSSPYVVCNGLIIGSQAILTNSTVSQDAGITFLNGVITLNDSLTLTASSTTFFAAFSSYGDDINPYATTNGRSLGKLYAPSTNLNVSIKLKLNASEARLAIVNNTSISASIPAGTYQIL